MAINIVLLEPEIPQNTGNIVRTCAATSSILHLIKPLGFDFSDKHLKRAGLDYWDLSKIKTYENLNDFYSKNKNGNFYYVSTKAKLIYSQIPYKNNDFFVFGKETKGLPEWLLEKNYDKTIRVPMVKDARSLNLSNAVAIVAYEALRQNNFENLQISGKLNNI